VDDLSEVAKFRVALLDRGALSLAIGEPRAANRWKSW
jgi:hypothetical protein